MRELNILGPTANPSRNLTDADLAGRQFRELEAQLRSRIAGEVRFDAGSRALYAVDSSNYRQVPIGVVVPQSIEDVLQTIATCRAHHAPVLSRGAGTSLAGQCCNAAIVMDWSKYLDQILNIDPAQKTARVRPGCVLDNLRHAAGRYGLTFGPDPATHKYCTVGGMLGNNSCGIHAQMAGVMASNTESLEIVLYDGTQMQVGWMTEPEWAARIAAGGREGEIMRSLRSLRDKYTSLIKSKFPDIPRRISGYNLDQLIPDRDGRVNLARALVGSEGTLVTILSATLRLVSDPPFQTLVVLGYGDVFQAGDDIPEVLESKPMGLEGIDESLIANMKRKSLYVEDVEHLPSGRAWLLVQLPGDTLEDSRGRARDLMERLKKKPNPPTMKLYDDKSEEKQVWDMREAGLGASAWVPGMPAAWPGWEDAAVPPSQVGSYLRDFRKLLNRYGYHAAIYGHFGMGCIHCRITFDLVTAEGIQQYRKFVEAAADLVVSHGGSLSGEHGDGQARAELLPKMFGDEIVQAFREYKNIWDPDWKMNPGKVVEPNRLDQNLRLAHYQPWEPATHFKFPDDEGKFSQATMRCVGVGKCRRQGPDVIGNQTMCPSYMVTREEMHSTRGRAHMLWEMLQGDPVRQGWRDENVKEALDLCLSCKGCKGDCPVNVDIATYKAEFLSHYWEGRIRPRSAYAFGLIDKWSQIASRVPGLVNWMTSTPGLRELAKMATGMPMERSIPQFDPQPFVSWFRDRKPARPCSKGKVMLFPDTFNNFFFPQTARAAVRVLEHVGYEVILPRRYACCGRPLYDHGLLDLAEKYLLQLTAVLRPALDDGIPIVVLEPSCWSVLHDEARQLLPHRSETAQLMESTFLLGDFLARNSRGELPGFDGKVLMHTHCHQKAIIRSAEGEAELLTSLGAEVDQLMSGCCGMAGSFGFEKDKYRISVQIGEQALLPAVRRAEADTMLLADGFSCRQQVSQLTNRHAMHLAEVLDLAIHHGDRELGPFPETSYIAEHNQAVKVSKQRAALGTAVAAGTVALLWGLSKWRA